MEAQARLTAACVKQRSRGGRLGGPRARWSWCVFRNEYEGVTVITSKIPEGGKDDNRCILSATNTIRGAWGACWHGLQTTTNHGLVKPSAGWSPVEVTWLRGKTWIFIKAGRNTGMETLMCFNTDVWGQRAWLDCSHRDAESKSTERLNHHKDSVVSTLQNPSSFSFWECCLQSRKVALLLSGSSLILNLTRPGAEQLPIYEANRATYVSSNWLRNTPNDGNE